VILVILYLQSCIIIPCGGWNQKGSSDTG